MNILLPEYLLVFVIGAALGSFLNVVIYRVPQGKSIVLPASHCPHCQRPIKAYENIPIASYIFLRGRCAGCSARISLQYPLVEAGMGLLAALLLARYGWRWELLLYGSMTAVLLSLSIIDIQTFRLPNKIVLTGAILAAALTLLFFRERWLSMILGGAVGLGLMVIMGLIGNLLFRKDTLGMGDIKLAGMMGLYLGPWHTAGMFILGVFIGAAVGSMMILLGGKKWGQRIPFGPYLAMGGLVSLCWGEAIWRWYLSLVIR
jgi:leader peptidase (prepilin peptidase)/N-methyltransferase